MRAFYAEAGRFERLRREAAALEARFPEPEERPPLYCVPVGVKDIFHVDGLPTTAGSRLPAELFAGEQAAAVSRLLTAGALVLGKTVSTEFAYFAPGPTRNPRDPERTPGGSSSGSAAAVAAGLTPLAFGTQTIGSISRPAAYCGVVGYKPSYDRIPRDGVVPLAPSADHVGVFTASVAGAELAAALLCEDWRPAAPESRSASTTESAAATHPGSTAATPSRDPAAVDRPRLAVPKGPYLTHATRQGIEHFKATCDRLEAAGFIVAVVPAMPDFDDIVARHRRLVAAEAARVHTTWYADYGSRYHPKTVELLEAGRAVTREQLADALAGREKLRRELGALMSERRIDLWVSPPAQGPAPLGLDSTGDPIMNLPWSHCGLPTLTIPAGTDEAGLPLGLQLAAGWYDDEKLLAWGRRLEEVLA